MIISITNQSRTLPQPSETSVRKSLNFSGASLVTFAPKIFSNVRGSLELAAQATANFSAKVFIRHVQASLNFGAQFSLEFAEQIRSTPGLNFRAGFAVNFSPRVAIPLVLPEPITTELPEGAFTAERYAARLFLNGVETKFLSFSYSRSARSTGANLNIRLAYPSRAQLAGSPSIKFEIGKLVAGEWSFHTLVDNSKLSSKNYSLAFAGDDLNFSTQSLIADKLAASPKNNIIAFNTFRVAVDTGELEPLYVDGGGVISTQLRPISGLTLYNLLQLAFVEGCGFSSYQTNIPNFEVTRCDFGISSTYLQSVAGLIGVFEPVFFAVGNVLWILDKTQTIPDEFTPRVLERGKITNLSLQTDRRELVDGFVVQYLAQAQGSTSSRTKTVIRDYGSFNIETTETFRDWKDSNNNLLKTELVSKRVEKRADFTLSVDTIENTFDGQGKKTLTLVTKQARVPDPNASLNRVLTDVSDVRVEYSYTTDPRNARRIVPREIVTQQNGLVVVDSENQYLGADFTQDILVADRAGNIREGMTTAYLPIKTTVASYKPSGNGQVEVERTVVDHLRGTIPDDSIETLSGDISLNSVLSVPRELVVYRPGVNSANKKFPVVPFPIGEMPLAIGRALAVRKLAQITTQPFQASVAIPGFDENLELGVYFAVPDREGQIGNFLTEEFTISGDASGIRTNIQSSQVFNENL